MSASVKLIVDKNLGHVLASFVETDPRNQSLTVPEVVGTNLPVRNSIKGKLQLPASHLELRDMPVPNEASKVTRWQVLERPREHIFTPASAPTKPDTLHAPIIHISNLQLETSLISVSITTTEVVEPLLKVKAFAQSWTREGQPQIFDFDGKLNAMKNGTNYTIHIPLQLEEEETYDVLVLVDGCEAFVKEEMKVTNTNK